MSKEFSMFIILVLAFTVIVYACYTAWHSKLQVKIYKNALDSATRKNTMLESEIRYVQATILHNDVKDIMTIEWLAMIAGQHSRAKGFHDTPLQFGTLLMLITSELAEALEADRNGKSAENLMNGTDGLTRLQYFEERIKAGVDYKTAYEIYIKGTKEEEIADTFIRLAELVDRLQIKPSIYINYKLIYNTMREARHGKAY